MTKLIGIYFIYSFLLGLVLSAYYLKKELFTSHGYELLILIFCPAVGLGYWSYYRELRAHGRTDLPQSWHIWRKMIRVHTGFIICLCFVAFTLLAGCGSAIGSGMDWAHQQNNGTAVGLGLLFDAASVAVVGVLMLAAIVIIGLLGGVMILVPYLVSGSIEKTTYATIYAQQRLREKTTSEQASSTIINNDTPHP